MPKKETTKTAEKAVKKAAAQKPAAAKEAVKKVVSKVAAKKAPAKEAVAETAVEKPAAKKAVKKVAGKTAKKAVAKKAPVVTTVIAKINAGFGNQVTIRGNSCGLTWDSGVAMENRTTDEWVWSSTAVTSELEFKVLLNDTTWSTGPNGVVFPGATVVFEPGF